MPKIDLICPTCCTRGSIETEEHGHINDNDDDFRTLVAPEGFRKVVFGWNSESGHFVCTKCGVVAEFAN